MWTADRGRFSYGVRMAYLLEPVGLSESDNSVYLALVGNLGVH
ncbi:hypothetical protein [Actinokineospora xionganensis]|nr:hypothetical protein [Actinokineospora xionganensis]